MDFGDILNRWENRKPEQTKKRTGAGAARPPQTEEPRVNPMDAWIRVNGIFDKDAEDRQEGSNPAEYRRRLRLKAPDAVIDIHGLTRDEAWDTLERFFSGARGQGLEKILVIHGKGNHSQGEAVLKRVAKEFIERCPYAGESGQGSPGGSGATWVLIKR